VRRVAVVGSGLIGSGWVVAFLASGREVAVYDPSPEAPDKIRAHIAASWPAMVELRLADRGDPDAVSFHRQLADAVRGADYIQENTPEQPELKTALFTELGDLAAADVIIASSTSNMPVTALQADCAYPERCVLGHPFNPAHLMPLVEVGGGERTAPEAIDAAMALYQAIGKQPIRLEREVLGHIANRLTAAMFREAVSLVAEGLATVGDVDKAIRYGPALKWAIQGQFTTFHTSGGENGFANFLRHFSPGMMRRWESMKTPDLADPALQARLVKQVDEAHPGQSVHDIAQHQDAMLLALLKLLD
jgi:3-hydroxyacyl-CoA dehydrogenase